MVSPESALPPLSQPLSAHPLYPELVKRLRAAPRSPPDASCLPLVLDVGCGLAKDLRLLAETANLSPAQCFGVDSETRFKPLALSLAPPSSSSKPFMTYLVADLHRPSSSPTPLTALEHRCTAVIAYRFLHIFPPEEQRTFLRVLLGFLRPHKEEGGGEGGGGGSSLLLGLQRAVAPPTTTTTFSTSSSDDLLLSSPSQEDSRTPAHLLDQGHWAWSASAWRRELAHAVEDVFLGNAAVMCGVEELGLDITNPASTSGFGRGALRWWIRVGEGKRKS